MSKQNYWAVLWRSENKRNGKKEHLVGDWKDPDQLGVKLFRTRREARVFAKERFGYIRLRKDLQAEPHGWKPPKVVKVYPWYEIIK